MSSLESRLVPWLGFVGDLLAEPLRSMPYEAIFDQLLDTFPATGVSYNWSGPSGGYGMITRPSGILREYDEVLAAWQRGELLLQHPLATWYVVSGDIRPTTSGRVPSSIVPRRDRSIVDTVLRKVGIEEQLSITFRLDGRACQAYVLGRSGSDFSADDLVVARQIQRLLVGLDRQLSVVGDRIVTGQSSYVDAGLTAREFAVLRLVAGGHTTRAIARQLCCSPRTVNKHLEHAYRKLGVRDRINAIRVVALMEIGPGRWPSASQTGTESGTGGVGVLQALQSERV